MQRSPAIMKVAVPWLQHSQRFGHCALSQTVCRPQIGNERLGRKENRIRRQPHLDPGRLLRLVQCRIDFRAGHGTKVTTLKLLQKLNHQPTCSILQAAASPASRQASRSKISGLSGFSGSANIGVVPPISPAGLQTQSGLDANFGYFS